MLSVALIYVGLALLNFFIPPRDFAGSFVTPSIVMGALYLGLWRWVRWTPGRREVQALFGAGLFGILFALWVIRVAPDPTSFYVLLSTMVGIGCISFDLRAISIALAIASTLGWLSIQLWMPAEISGALVPQLLGTAAFSLVLTWIRRATLADAVQSIHELELRVREERVVLDAALDAVIISDYLGNIVEWNGQARKIFGWSREEVLGERLADTIIPERYRSAHEAGMKRMQSGGEPHVVGSRIEIEAVDKTGREFPIELAITRSSLPTTVQFTAFLRDITQRRAAERAQVLARETAEEADRLKSEFLATISHEIRTPLNGIFGMTEMALEASQDEERRDYLQRSQQCAETLISLVGDVLDFSRFESGQIELERISFDLRKLSEGAIDIFSVEAAAKGVELIATIDPRVPSTIMGDPTRVRQVLLNLLGNAVKFTSKGYVALKINLADTRDPALLPHMSLEVEDTGIGMAQKDLGMIFDVFRQADASTTRRFGGVGLGLAISQRLVVLMGGEIQVRSTVGEGSRFFFELPLEAGPAEPVVAGSPWPAAQVLVWEASTHLAANFQRLFEAWGSAVTVVGGFSEACEAIGDTQTPYDLIMIRVDASGDPAEINQVLATAQAAQSPVLATCPIGELASAHARFPGTARILTRPGSEAALREAARNATSSAPGD
jgi:PAS domain S-box-containing protein